MDLVKSNYSDIAISGNIDLFKCKMKMKRDKINDIKNICDGNSMSLLLYSLAYRNLDIADYLIENDAEVNIVSKDGYNELHCIAANICDEKSAKIARKLVDRGVDLNLKDKYGNTPLWHLCFAANADYYYELIEYCFSKKPNIDEANNAGMTIRNMIMSRENPHMIKLLEKYE